MSKPPLTVEELIEKLKTYNPKLQVSTYGNSSWSWTNEVVYDNGSDSVMLTDEGQKE